MKKVILIFIAVVSIVTSCNEDLLNTKNPNQITDDAFYTTLDQIGTSVTAIYAVLQGNRMVGREYFFIHDLRSDDNKAGGGQLEVPRAQLLNGSHSYTNAVMSDVFAGLFTMVHRANIVIVKGAELSVPAGDQALLAWNSHASGLNRHVRILNDNRSARLPTLSGPGCFVLY